MKVYLPALLLLAVALPTQADDDIPKVYTPINRPGHASSHVMNDINQVQELRRALKQAQTAAVATGNGIDYHGGPVMTNTVTIYYIWYGNWNGNNGVTLLESLATNLGGSPYYNINTTYTDSTGNAVKNSLIFGGSTVDNYSLGKNLTDAQIWQAISTAISSGKFPADPNAVYFLLTSADVNATSGFCSQYCGWHTYNVLNGTKIKYSFVGDAGRCPSGCSAQPTNSPNGNVGADGMASVLSHELSEATTDPELNAWWQNSTGEENADKCAWTFGVTFAAPNGSRANVTLGGNNYLIQQNWVNAGGGSCTMQYLIPALTAISPVTGTAGASIPVTLTGTNFATGVNLAISGVGVTTSNLTVVSPTQITATLNIASTADLGAHSITVTSGAATSSAVPFNVDPPPFKLTGVSPATGAAGTTVPITLAGTNFTGTPAINFSGPGVVVSNVKLVSATQVTATLVIDASASPGARNMTMTIGSITSAPIVYNVTSTAMTLTSLSPSSSPVGFTSKVTFTGTNFAAGSTISVFGTGVTVSSLSIVSSTQITANIAVASNAATGTRNVTVVNGTRASSPLPFTITAPSVVTSYSPTSAQAGGTANLILNGSNFVPGATIAFSGSGVTASATTVASSSQLTASLLIDKNATPGPRTMTVSMGSTTIGQGTFTISAVSTLTGLTPASALPGTTTRVTLTGTNFSAKSNISVSGVGISITGMSVVNATQMTANFVVAAAAAAGARNVTVTTGTVISSPLTFTVASAPTLTSLSPASAGAGATVSVTLTGTQFATGATVAVSGTGVTVSAVTIVNSTQLTARFAIASNAAPGARTITINPAAATAHDGIAPSRPAPASPWWPGGPSLLAAAGAAPTFTITPAPTLTSISPSTAIPGTSTKVTLTGTNFMSDSTVAVSGSGVSVTTVAVVSATQITATLVSSATATVGARSVTVTSASITTTPATFNVTAVPMTFTSFSPSGATAGTAVAVTLTGTRFATGATVVVSGSGVTVSGVTVVSATQINAQFAIGATAPAGTRTITVSNGSASVTAVANFTISAAALTPTLTRLDKVTAAAGLTLSIAASGTNFTSANKINVSGAGVTISNQQMVSATQLTATLAIDRTAVIGTRNVTVSYGNSATAPLTFMITPATIGVVPTITSMSPASGVLGSALIMSLKGTGFTQNATVTTDSDAIPVLQTTFISGTQLTVVLGLGGSIGQHTLKVSVPGTPATVSAPANFTITAPPPPTVSSATPATAALKQTVSITIQGANFTPDMQVAISGTGVSVGNITSAGPTFVTVPLTITSTAAVGVRTLTVSTPGGRSNTLNFTITSK